MKRTLATLSLLPFLAAPASAGGGCHADGPAREAPATRVVIEHACFDPVVASVAPGATVTFVNASGIEHNLTGPAVEFTELPAGATHALTFDRTGVYVFACTLHPGMSGAVIVRDAPAAQSGAAPAAVPPAPASGTSSSGFGTPALALAAVGVLAAAALVLRNSTIPGVTPRTR